MNPYEQLRDEYGKHGLSLAAYLALHLHHGFVFSTPEIFVMGRPVCRTAPKELIRNPQKIFTREESDAWWVHGLGGDVHKLLDLQPYPLPYLGFERFDENLRFYPVGRLVAHVMTTEGAN